jgi:hypothetical protein
LDCGSVLPLCSGVALSGGIESVPLSGTHSKTSRRIVSDELAKVGTVAPRGTLIEFVGFNPSGAV